VIGDNTNHRKNIPDNRQEITDNRYPQFPIGLPSGKTMGILSGSFVFFLPVKSAVRNSPISIFPEIEFPLIVPEKV
jgi:hypothetical protein